MWQKQSENSATPRILPIFAWGGIIALAVVNLDGMEKSSLATESFGAPDALKLPVYSFHAHEKFRRLCERRMAGNREIASRESANEALKTFAGCVVFTDRHGREFYISVSGGLPDVDEAVAFAVGKLLGLIAPTYENPLNDAAIKILEEGVTPFPK